LDYVGTGKLDPDVLKEEVTNLEARTYDANFWSDPKEAADVMKRINQMKKELGLKIGQQMHSSSKEVISKDMPFLKIVASKALTKLPRKFGKRLRWH